MAKYIPRDILLNHIFIRLSAKTLLNCSCVCKLWRRIISGSEFKRIHAQYQSKHVHRHRNIICGPLKYRHSYETYKYEMSQDQSQEFRTKVSASTGIFYSLDLESTPPKLNRLLGFPVHCMNNFELIKSLGYSNGMMCMEARSTSNRKWPHIFFGNPSTGYYKILPDPLVNGPIIVGFGNDSFTDDHKFVRIDNVTRHPQLYSLKSNSWSTNLQSRSDKHKSNLEYSYLHNYVSSAGTFVDGSIYWYVNASIVRFDLKEEKFTDLPMPRGITTGSVIIKAVQGSLCMVNCGPCHGKIDVDMWLLKKKKITKSYYWIKLLSLSNYYAKKVYPLSVIKDGKVVCSVENEYEVKGIWPPKSHYVLINPHTSEIEHFAVSGINSGILQDFVFESQYSGYVDTFVSPKLVSRGTKRPALESATGRFSPKTIRSLS